MLARLRGFLRHKHGCDKHPRSILTTGDTGSIHCTCGLDRVLRWLEGAEKRYADKFMDTRRRRDAFFRHPGWWLPLEEAPRE